MSALSKEHLKLLVNSIKDTIKKKELTMSNMTVFVFVLFVAFWIYSIISIFRGNFKQKKQKTFWLIGVVFVPFLAFFYLFVKKDLLLK